MSEIDRILALPMIDVKDVDVDAETRKYRVPGGSWSLFPHQAAALRQMELNRHRGVVLPMGVGAGKTLISYLAPVAYGIDPEDALILTASSLIPQGIEQMEEYRQHFNVEPILYLTHGKLSRDATAIGYPKLIVVDEVHMLRQPKARRTRHFVDHIKQFPDTIVVVMTATFAEESIRDMAHLIYMALGADGTPLPTDWPMVSAWSRVLDVRPRMKPTSFDYHRFQPIYDAYYEGEYEYMSSPSCRRVFQKKFFSTPGVINTEAESYDGDVNIYRWTSEELPQSLRAAIRTAWDEGILPDGSELYGPAQQAQAARCLAQGGYYTLDWPDGTPDPEWQAAEVMWLFAWRRAGFETEAEARSAVSADEASSEMTQAWQNKEACAHLEPDRVWHWIDDTPLQNVLTYAQDNLEEMGPALIWCSHVAVAEWFADRIPTALAGDPVPDGDVVAVSVGSHTAGHHLVKWGHSIVLSPPGQSSTWQQLIGRTARYGQKRPAVHISVRSCTREYRRSWDKARSNALFLKDLLGMAQKLLDAHISEC